MTLYDIDREITDLIDPETGELTNFEAFEALSMEREEKLENLVLWVKDLTAEAKAIKEERDALYARQKAAENKAESVKRFLQRVLEGEKFKTARCAVSYRKSSAVVPDPEFTFWAETNAGDLLTYGAPRPNLTAIKAALENGRKLEYVSIEERTNMTIK